MFSLFINGFELTYQSLYACELDSISNFQKNNNLDNITVYVGTSNVERLSDSYPNLTVRTKNIFLESMIDKISIKQNGQETDFQYKFISPNVRYQGYRHIIVAYLQNFSALTSLNFTDQIYLDLNKHLWFELSKWRNTFPKLFKKISAGKKIITDNTILEHKELDVHCNFDDDYDFASSAVNKKAFCFIVNESRFAYPLSILSEKILIPILNKRPFVLVAPPLSLQYLKSLGFKTFDQWWDESYDQEENHEKRLIKILELIDYIDTLSITELKSIHHDMLNILEHNFNLLLQLKNSK